MLTRVYLNISHVSVCALFTVVVDCLPHRTDPPGRRQTGGGRPEGAQGVQTPGRTTEGDRGGAAEIDVSRGV